MKNKKGFTLVELLAILAILGIISVVAVPNITKQLNEKEIQEQNILNLKIENAAMLYVSKYYAREIINGDDVTLTLNDLINEGLLNLNGSECSSAKNTEITFEGKDTDYSVLEDCYIQEN